MNEFQLQCIPSRDLEILRTQIVAELARRSSPKMLKKRLEKIGKSLADPDARSIINKSGFENNSSRFLYPPKYTKTKIGKNAIYFPALLAQDWSHLFYGLDDSPIYYVYAHVDPRGRVVQFPKGCGDPFGGTPFYIGKGSGDRAYQLKRNQGHGKMIKAVMDAGYSQNDFVRIIFSGLTEAKALEIESKLIFFFGTVYQERRKYGCLYNLDIPSTPEFEGPMTEVVTRTESKAWTPLDASRLAPGTLPMEEGFSKEFA